jgi:hypothetical protein
MQGSVTPCIFYRNVGYFLREKKRKEKKREEESHRDEWNKEGGGEEQ